MLHKKIVCCVLSALLLLGSGICSVSGKTPTVNPNSSEIVTRATGRFSMSVPARTIRSADSSFPMEYNETITISATYTPSNASVDFGLYGPDGVFRYVTVNNGMISQTIRIDQGGNYTFAIRNNSSQPIHVSGYVNY